MYSFCVSSVSNPLKRRSLLFTFRDDDTIGKDDFDGQCFIELSKIPENQTVQWEVPLTARPNKKEKIDGFVTVELYIISDKLREELGSHELKATSQTRLSVDGRKAALEAVEAEKAKDK